VFGPVRKKTATDEMLAKDNIKNVQIFEADITDLLALKVSPSNIFRSFSGYS
jgi:hypothetical protein